MTRPKTQHIQLFFSFWLISLFIALPVSYDFLPNVGNWVSNGLYPLNAWFCSIIFNLEIHETYLISDSAAFYSTAIFLLPITYIISLILLKFAKISLDKSLKLSYSILVYCISFYLLRYGIDKLVGNQFYVPAPNTLHTELGNMSKDILYWSTMGVSPEYNLFMALTEMLTGILLLWKRTRFLALLMSFGIFANVLATNIGFEITVKYLSTILLLTTLFCLSFHVEQLKAIVGIEPNDQKEPVIFQRTRRIILKSFIVLIIALETISQYYDIETPQNFATKSFEIESVQSKSNLFDLSETRRVHFHRKGYLITENWDGKMKSTKISKTQNGFRIAQTTFRLNPKTSILSWNENEHVESVYLREIDLGQKAIFRKNDSWLLEKNIAN